MSPRGATRDNAITDLLYENQLFLDSRSFVSLSNPPHLYLKGVDMTVQRHRVWTRDRGICQICSRVPRYDIEHEGWQMDHILSKGKLGSDDLQNLRAICKECHRKRHLHTRFGEKRANAVEDFNKVQEKP